MINDMDYEIKLIQSMFIDCNCYLINYLDYVNADAPLSF